MTTYTGFGTGPPSGLTFSADASEVTLGTAFKVTSSGMTLTKVRLFAPSGSGAPTTGLIAGVFAVSGSNAAEPPLTSGAMGTITLDAWNEWTLPSPLALTSGAYYVVAVSTPGGGYGAKASVFSTEVTVGPITFPADSVVRNGEFKYGTGLVAPVSSFNAAWYGVDLEVSDGGTAFAVAGTVAATATTVGNLVAHLKVSGASVASAGASGTLVALEAVRGTVEVTSATSGALRALLKVSGTAAASATASGAPTRVPRIFGVSGTVAAVSAVTGNASRSSSSVDLIGPVMSAILSAVAAYLEPGVGRASLYSGAEAAWDDCCEGQVWVRALSVVPTGRAQPGVARGCGPVAWTVTLGIGVLRCAATLDDQGRAPTPQRLTEETLQMSSDRAAVAQALQCEIAPGIDSLTFVRWSPLGPSGGCVGGEWQVQVMITNCGCG